jgi:hypothetical protein
MKNDEELGYFLLIPADRAPLLEDDEYVLIYAKSQIRKPVLLYYKHKGFEKHLRYFKKIIWN